MGGKGFGLIGCWVNVRDGDVVGYYLGSRCWWRFFFMCRIVFIVSFVVGGDYWEECFLGWLGIWRGVSLVVIVERSCRF